MLNRLSKWGTQEKSGSGNNSLNSMKCRAKQRQGPNIYRGIERRKRTNNGCVHRSTKFESTRDWRRNKRSEGNTARERDKAAHWNFPSPKERSREKENKMSKSLLSIFPFTYYYYYDWWIHIFFFNFLCIFFPQGLKLRDWIPPSHIFWKIAYS